MNTLRQDLSHEIDSFFDDVRSGKRNQMEMGQFVLDLAPPDVACALLEEVEHDPAGAADVDTSFNVRFDRITFNMGALGSGAPWRLRSHLFDPAVAATLRHEIVGPPGRDVDDFDPDTEGEFREPIHLHKWFMGSVIRYGEMRSDYAFVTDTNGDPMPPRQRRDTGLPAPYAPQPVATPADRAAALPIYYYSEAGTRERVQPRLVGRSLLTHMFTHTVPRGSAYSQSVDLAHGVRLSHHRGPVVTTALMGPAVYRDGVFLEKTPDMPDRPGAQAFNLDQIAAVASRMRGLILTPPEPMQEMTASPWPNFLAVHTTRS